MNYKHILLSMALTLPLSSMSMDRKRCFESSEEEESFGDQNASEKRSRASTTRDDIFIAIEQISLQMNQVNLGSDRDADDYAENNANPLKRAERFEDQDPDDEMAKKNKEHEAPQMAHSFDGASIRKNIKDQISAQLDAINKAVENSSAIPDMNLFEQYVSLVNDLLKTYEQFFPGNSRKYGYNTLHMAAGLGHLPVVKFLIEECNMDFTVKTTRHQCTPRMLAIANGKKDVAAYLWEKESGWFFKDDE